MAGYIHLLITLRPQELITELGAVELDKDGKPVGFLGPSQRANPGMGHHTAAQCPYLGCPGPHAVGPYRTDCPMCGKTKAMESGRGCRACGYKGFFEQPWDRPLRWRKLANVKEEPVTWLWPKYLAAGKLNLLIGDPDIGKSLFVCDVAARITSGKPWPDGAPPAPATSCC